MTRRTHGGGDHVRDPCPDRIIGDAGASFAMGTIGGVVVHYIRGRHDVASGLERVRMNALGTGGSFAVWGGLFSIFDCSNSIASGTATGGFLALRNGPRAVAGSTLFGGVLLALIEGVAIQMNKLHGQYLAVAPPQSFEIPDPLSHPAPETSSSSSSGSGDLFGWGKKKNNASILESFETPAPPVIYDNK